MQLNASQISAQASAQAAALASLMLLRKTLELQSAGAAGLIQAAAPAAAPSNPAHLGNSIDLLV